MRDLRTEKLTVGYDGVPLIRDICIRAERGRILTLIGPNGAGKSTVLKTITNHLASLGGTVYLGSDTLSRLSPKALAKTVAVVLTDRVSPELMTCFDVAATGRYPYTDLFGRLTQRDRKAVSDALELVGAADLAGRDFSLLSDGQRQRVLLARAICQEPEILVLDEPTAFLDVRYKLELLQILRHMAEEKGVTVILSMHEIDLALKTSDLIVCVGREGIAAFGTPEEILRSGQIEPLYGLEAGAFEPLSGGVELPGPRGEAQVFVVSGGGSGVPLFRALQRKGIPFAAGILFENDVETPLAKRLARRVVTAAAFREIPREAFDEAAALLRGCKWVLDAGTPVGTLNACNGELLRLARESGVPVRTTIEEEI